MAWGAPDVFRNLAATLPEPTSGNAAQFDVQSTPGIRMTLKSIDHGFGKLGRHIWMSLTLRTERLPFVQLYLSATKCRAQDTLLPYRTGF